MKINDIFYTIQGEGSFAGTPAIFIRLSDCNLACKFCDTEFLSGSEMKIGEIVSKCLEYQCRFIVLTGGEPTMNDELPELAMHLKRNGFFVTIETNGMFDIDTTFLDWICLSPKSGWKSIKIKRCHDLKFVVKKGGKIPHIPNMFKYERKFISPMNETSGEKIGTKSCDKLNKENTDYCIDLIKENPGWILNLQTHKIIGVE